MQNILLEKVLFGDIKIEHFFIKCNFRIKKYGNCAIFMLLKHII